MNGANWEAVSAYIANGNSDYSIWNNSYTVKEINNEVNKISTKYATVYKHDTSYDNSSIDRTDLNYVIATCNNFNENINVYGDAICELVQLKDNLEYIWNGNFAGFTALSSSVFMRGTRWGAGEKGGIFSYGRFIGYPVNNYSFRVALVVK